MRNLPELYLFSPRFSAREKVASTVAPGAELLLNILRKPPSILSDQIVPWYTVNCFKPEIIDAV